MKKSFATLVAVLATLCTTSTALAETPTPAPDTTPKTAIPGMPQLYYSATRAVGIPPRITMPPKDAQFNIGNNAELHVKFTGLRPLVRVFHDKKEIAETKRHQIAITNNTCILYIRSVSYEDAGTYCFEISNDFGKASATATISISGTPE